MHAVILAAGDGDRLHPYTDELPKAALPLAGRPIIGHVLDALAAAGIDTATIVLGYRAEQVREAVARATPAGMRVRFARNDDYLAGNAGSLWAAREHIKGSFVLAMGDHVTEPALLRALVDRADGRCRLAVEHVGSDDARADEATRARVREGRVEALGKSLDEWNALDTGLFWCTPSILDALTPARRDGELARVFADIAQGGKLDAIDVTGCQWIDIDTEADLRRAESLFAAHGRFA